MQFVIFVPTLADGVTDRSAALQLHIRLLAHCAGQTRVERGFLVWERVINALLAHRVAVEVTAQQHPLTHRTHRAGLAAACDAAEKEAVVTDADGVVGVGAGRQHAHEIGTGCTRLTFLRVAEVLGERLAWRQTERKVDTLGVLSLKNNGNTFDHHQNSQWHPQSFQRVSFHYVYTYVLVAFYKIAKKKNEGREDVM